MAEDRTPRETALTAPASDEEEADRSRKREPRHRRPRGEPDRRDRPDAIEHRFPGRTEHEGAVSKLL